MINSLLDIVLVEDNPTDIELTLEALREGHIANRVRVLKDGEIASQCIFQEGEYKDDDICSRPSLILLDLHLPKIDGLDILRRMRADERTKQLSVIVLTSSRLDKDKIESYKLGINGYLVKPVQMEEFVRVVAEVGFYWAALKRPPPLSKYPPSPEPPAALVHAEQVVHLGADMEDSDKGPPRPTH